MHTHSLVPGETLHRATSHPWRYAAVGVAALCLAVAGYEAVGILRDFQLVDQAFPGLPSDFTEDVNAAILFSPVAIQVERAENAFLRGINYPIPEEPFATPPPADPIGAEIVKAQKEQGMRTLAGAVPVANIEDLKRPSLEAFGRAIYLSQNSPADRQAFEKDTGKWSDAADLGQQTGVQQVRQIFQMAYGPNVLQQATRPVQ